MLFHEDFELSANTMAIIPIQYGSKLYSKILEVDDELISPYRPFEIIEKSCRLYASSFEGRREGTKELIGITHKSPIVIDPFTSIYFFPTSSPNRPHCYWISLDHVQHFQRKNEKETEVLFRNKETLIVPISPHSFENQLLRTALLRTKLQQRLLENERKTKYYIADWQAEALEKKRFYRS